MFVDEAKIFVKGGDGGDGIVAWRREKYVPMGGPAGGDGGRGGDVVLEVDEGLRTLIDFKYQRHFKAERGENGGPKNQHGRSADDLVVKVPPGTVVRDAETGEILGDLVAHGQRLVVARGGRGGRGNAHFATPTRKAPEIAERGEPGEARWLLLELKVLADVGLVGFPSVGKSTLLAAVSAARPKVADYPFTTLHPHLGVVRVEDGRSFVMADLPGLIEGAHAGHGLGHEFLRHVERTRVIVHVIDVAAVEGRDPVTDYQVITEELRLYDPALAERPTVIAANKMDLPDAAANLARFRDAYPHLRVYPVSGATRQGLQELLRAVADLLDEVRAQEAAQAQAGALGPAPQRVYRYVPPKRREFTIRRDGEVFVVESPELEKLVRMTNFDLQDAVRRFQHILRQRGVDDALREHGAKDGDLIRIGEMEFDFVD
ncbi:GTPase Obg [Alicyclobacillus cellulosilyticus]|uniref:GTPase Obg n=1 Tax=Alicyclobacillus cellulosilyticus TaxID=1003997 RepID=A0A917K1H3_9BACL|nr:GTPase ObgE [Alicyclobacillus cellulosilyticus]GGI96156.1 GTPase Obg [Alicyclobacillus cellulosilyticus]